MSHAVLVVIETRRGAVIDSSLAAIGAGLQLKEALGGRLVLGVAGSEPEKLIGELSYDGVDEILTCRVDDQVFDPELREEAVIQFGAAVSAVAIIFGHSVDSMAVAPALAAKYELGLATDVIGVGFEDGDVHATRVSYGGQLHETMRFPQPCVILTVRASAFKAPDQMVEALTGEEFDTPELDSGRLSHRRWIEPVLDGVDITKADLLVSVGRPIGSAENVARVDTLATALGGVMSASRPVIDSGWAEPGRQVGQTGKTVTPKVYLALGISGAIQHIAGMIGSETIIAVNTDRSAPIFDYADYVAQVDMLDFVEALESAVGVIADG